MVSWKALKEGTRRIWVHKKLLLWLYFVNVLFAAIPVLPFRHFVQKISRSDLSDDFVSGFHINSFLDVWHQHSDQLSAAATAALVVGVVYLIVNVFLTGGIVGTFAGESKLTLRRFSTSAGRYFWRYLRLLLFLLIIVGALVAADQTWLAPIVEEKKKSITNDRDTFLLWAGHIALLLVVFAFVFMVFDYAKIRTVIQKRRSMFVVGWSALGFVLRRPCRTITLFVMNLLLLGVLFTIYLLVENVMSNSTYTSMLMLIVVQQLLILGRIWMKLLFFASQTALYQETMGSAFQRRSAPPIITVPTPQAPSPASGA